MTGHHKGLASLNQIKSKFYACFIALEAISGAPSTSVGSICLHSDIRDTQYSRKVRLYPYPNRSPYTEIRITRSAKIPVSQRGKERQLRRLKESF